MTFDPNIFQFPEPLLVACPQYPLDREAFDRALTTGHGRTLVHAMRFGVEPFRDLILDAALRCRYTEPCVDYYPPLSCPVSGHTDIQGWSLAKLCVMAGAADEVRNAPIEGGGCFYERNACQRERILEELVAGGHMPPPPEWNEIHSEWTQRWQARLASDGEAGMLAVAEAFGREQLNREVMGVWHVSDAIEYYDHLHGAGASMRLLAPETARNRAILRFVRVHRRNQLRMQMVDKAEAEEFRNYQPDPPATIDEVMQFIHGAGGDHFSIRWFPKKATHEERLRIQRVLYDSTESTVLRRALFCLRETGLPEFAPSLLALAAHDDQEVRQSAAIVFRNHGQPAVREAALKALAGGDKDSAFRLLHRSAVNSDSLLLLELLRGLWQDGKIYDPHLVFVASLDIAKDNANLLEPTVLLFVYEHSPCRVCRREAFRLMMERGIQPDWVLEEARWDAMPGIREMAAGAQP